MAEKRTTYKITGRGGISEVKIADEVVTVIAGCSGDRRRRCCFHGRQYHKRTGKQNLVSRIFQKVLR